MKESKAFSNPEILSQLKITTIDKGTPIYIEIYRRIRRLVKSNVLQYGEQLPGEERLSQIMGVGRTSLRTALTILYEDGYIKTLRGKGSYVAYDARKEKYRKQNPAGIILPTERIELIGTLTKEEPVMCDVIEKDEFLEEKLGKSDGESIWLFKRLYRLNGEAAISANYYQLSSMIDITGLNKPDDIEAKIIQEIKLKSVVAECEVMSVPISFINIQEERPGFTGEHHVLVSTTYVDKDNKVIAFCKDYYNDAVIRFRTSLKK